MIGCQIMTAPAGGTLIADWTQRITTLAGVDGETGWETLTGFVAMNLMEAMEFYSRTQVSYVLLTDYTGMVIWRGRLEDARLRAEGIEFMAVGLRASLRVPYTALWSSTDYAPWRPIENEEAGEFVNDAYSVDNNNRLYLAPMAGESYGSGKLAGIGFEAPHLGRKGIVQITFTYQMYLPASDWVAELRDYDHELNASATVWSLTSTGAVQSGTVTVSIGTYQERLVFALVHQAVSGDSYTGETGEYWFKVTGIRVKTVSGDVNGTAVAADVLAAARELNANELLSTHLLIADVDVDEMDTLYEDALGVDVLDEQAQVGDGATPPLLVETGVEDRAVFFRPLGSARQDWHVMLLDMELNRSLDGLVNSAYGLYRNAFGATRRTAVNTDALSQAAYGLVKQDYTSSRSVSAGEAEGQRDQLIAELADVVPDTHLVIGPPMLPGGGVGRPWALWPWRGDVVIVQNLPATVGPELERIREMRVVERQIDYVTGELTVTLEFHTPDESALLAQAVILASAAYEAVGGMV